MERIIWEGPEFLAVSEDGVLTEFFPTRENQGMGDIIAGRIERMMAGLDSAFVDIGRKKSGFLPLRETSLTFQEGKVRTGDKILVQIRREETGAKGAFLSRDITLPGEYIMLMPMNRYIGVSSRVKDEAVREMLKTLGKRIANGRFGLVMRRKAAEAGEKDVSAEAGELLERWRIICERMNAITAPGIVYRQGNPAEELKRDYGKKETRTIQTDELPEPLKMQLDAALKRVVSTRHGGTLVFDQCEAMTVVDVNTASAALGKDRKSAVLEMNLESCDTLSHQIRLRNISGIILIDMIDMEDETDRSLVLERLRKSFEEDRAKVVIHGFTSLGLIEMTRKRSRPALREMMQQPCPVCGGSGMVFRERSGETDKTGQAGLTKESNKHEPI